MSNSATAAVVKIAVCARRGPCETCGCKKDCVRYNSKQIAK